jgi:hypothetical protein
LDSESDPAYFRFGSKVPFQLQLTPSNQKQPHWRLFLHQVGIFAIFLRTYTYKIGQSQQLALASRNLLAPVAITLAPYAYSTLKYQYSPPSTHWSQ